jgi:hypothetical protein
MLMFFLWVLERFGFVSQDCEKLPMQCRVYAKLCMYPLVDFNEDEGTAPKIRARANQNRDDRVPDKVLILRNPTVEAHFSARYIAYTIRGMCFYYESLPIAVSGEEGN